MHREVLTQNCSWGTVMSKQELPTQFFWQAMLKTKEETTAVTRFFKNKLSCKRNTKWANTWNVATLRQPDMTSSPTLSSLTQKLGISAGFLFYTLTICSNCHLFSPIRIWSTINLPLCQVTIKFLSGSNSGATSCQWFENSSYCIIC